MLRAALMAVCLGVGTAAPAQTTSEPSMTSPILIINQDRILTESTTGAEALRVFEDAARELADENNLIEAELIEEERALTEERPNLPVEEFRTRADAFDARVQRIRAEQDQKARAIQRDREGAQVEMIRQAGTIIREISRERGALVVLEQRDVVLSADAIDITEEVIRRIDASGDRTGAPQ